MNSTEHIDHVAEANKSLLFTTIFKESWAVFKKKWCALYTLALVPFIFAVSVLAIVISAVFIVAKFAGDGDVITNIFSVFYSASEYVSVVGAILGAIIVIGMIYFSLRASVASIKVLEADSNITIRNAWHGISLKTIASLFGALVLFGIIIMGGYYLLFVPILFLVTFYCNVVFTNVIDGKKGTAALALSRHYVKGYGTTVFVNLLVIVSIGMLFGLFFELAFKAGGLLALAVYFGKLSIISAFIISFVVLTVGLLLSVLWKSFAFVYSYLMYKKLKSLKAHHTPHHNDGKKTIKTWLIIGIITLAVYVGVSIALEHDKGPRDIADFDGYEQAY